MESTNTKWFAAGFTMLIIMLLFSVTQFLHTAHNSTSLEDFLNVSMPRPVKEFILGFSLEGRTVIREIEAGISAIPELKKVDPKPKGSTTKAIADKGQKAKAAVSTRAQLNEQRRQAFQARVIEQAERYRQSLRTQSSPYADYETEYNVYRDTKSQSGGDETSPDKEKHDKKTAAEWKSLILSQPSEANVQKMMKALPAGEIDLETYLEISETLIKDNSQDKRRMGVWALTAVYKQEAFVLASHLVGDTDSATQKLLNDYMYNYNRSQTLGILDLVLKSQDTIAAAAAAQSITRAIQTLKSQQSSGSHTGGTVQQLSLNSYQRLIPTLKFVIAKNLNNLSQWAQNLLSQLQTGTTTA
jgi:hypothetical protein